MLRPDNALDISIAEGFNGGMFDGFARQWTPILPSPAVKAAPQRSVVAGEAVVVWRDKAGKASVLLDRCPHRGVSLALGTRTPDGDLACGFHGWEFGADGGCRHLPFNPDTNRATRGATALPSREVGGLLWVFTGFDPDAEPTVAPHLSDPTLTRFDYAEEWDCHWTRAMENMLDFPHLPYVHRTTIGRFVRGKQRRDSRLNYDIAPTDYGFQFGTRVDDSPPGAHLQWYRPNSMILDTIPDPRVMRVQIFCIPTAPDKTRMLLVTVRNFAKNPAASVAFDRFNLKVLHQDRAIVESSRPVEVPASGERSAPTDQPTLRFRTWYLRNLRETSVTDPRDA